MSILLRFWLVGAPCCCPWTLAGPLDAGRSSRRWLVPLTLAGPLNAGWSPQRWRVPSTLAGPLNAGRFPQQWLVPSMLVPHAGPSEVSC